MKRAAYVVVVAFAALAIAQEHANVPSPPADAKSLHSYFLAILRAEQAGDVDAVQRLADDLKLPDAVQWLNDAFGLDQAKVLADRYDRSFAAFRSRLIDNLKWADHAAAKISVKYRTKPVTGVAASPAAPTPRAHVDIESFKFMLTATGKGRTEWMDSYVKVDGRLRYIGQGAFPFWAGLLSITIKKKPH